MLAAIVVATILFFIGLLLLLHHGWKHAQDDPASHAKQESCCLVCFFQLKDIIHAETWILLSISNSISITLSTLNPSTVNENYKLAGTLLAAALMIVGLVTLCVLIAIRQIELQHIKNHETWILFLWTNAAGIAFIGTA